MSSKNFADKVMPFLEKYNTYTSKDKAAVMYGLEGLYILITKTIVITIISIILGITIEMYIFLIAYGLLRFCAGGAHLSNSIECTVISTLIFIGVTYLSIYTYMDISYKVIIIGISICTFALYSPADTEKKPLIRANDRIKKKIASLILCCIYLIILFVVKKSFILNVLTYSLLLEAFMITPLAYRLFKQPYNNYIKYGNYGRKEE
jgi:accessory gene regulator B